MWGPTPDWLASLAKILLPLEQKKNLSNWTIVENEPFVGSWNFTVLTEGFSETNNPHNH